MNSRRKILVAVGVGLVLTFSKPVLKMFRNTDTILNKIGCRLYEFNRIKVNVRKGVDLEDVEVRNREKVVFENGCQKSKMTQDYGHLILSVYYKDVMIYEFGHFKTNNWYSNNYEVTLSQFQNEIKVSHKISGPDRQRDCFHNDFPANY